MRAGASRVGRRHSPPPLSELPMDERAAPPPATVEATHSEAWQPVRHFRRLL